MACGTGDFKNNSNWSNGNPANGDWFVNNGGTARKSTGFYTFVDNGYLGYYPTESGNLQILTGGTVSDGDANLAVGFDGNRTLTIASGGTLSPGAPAGTFFPIEILWHNGLILFEIGPTPATYDLISFVSSDIAIGDFIFTNGGGFDADSVTLEAPCSSQSEPTIWLWLPFRMLASSPHPTSISSFALTMEVLSQPISPRASITPIL